MYPTSSYSSYTSSSSGSSAFRPTSRISAAAAVNTAASYPSASTILGQRYPTTSSRPVYVSGGYPTAAIPRGVTSSSSGVTSTSTTTTTTTTTSAITTTTSNTTTSSSEGKVAAAAAAGHEELEVLESVHEKRVMELLQQNQHLSRQVELWKEEAEKSKQHPLQDEGSSFLSSVGLSPRLHPQPDTNTNTSTSQQQQQQQPPVSDIAVAMVRRLQQELASRDARIGKLEGMLRSDGRGSISSSASASERQSQLLLSERDDSELLQGQRYLRELSDALGVIATLRQERQELRQRLEQQAALLSESEDELHATQAEVRSLEQRVETLLQAHEKATSEKKVEIARLMATVDDLNTKLNAAQAQIAQAASSLLGGSGGGSGGISSSTSRPQQTAPAASPLKALEAPPSHAKSTEQARRNSQSTTTGASGGRAAAAASTNAVVPRSNSPVLQWAATKSAPLEQASAAGRLGELVGRGPPPAPPPLLTTSVPALTPRRPKRAAPPVAASSPSPPLWARSPLTTPTSLRLLPLPPRVAYHPHPLVGPPL